jgi:dihydrofolate reductase
MSPSPAAPSSSSAAAVRPTLSLIAAVAQQRAIGRANDLLWSEPEDQQHFRRVTTGCPVIMGRKTWDSLPARFRPLPGRRNIVITRNAGWRADGAEAVTSLSDALALCAGAAKVFVIGGAQIYAEALPQADELVLTEVDLAFKDADTFFPDWPRAQFDEVSRVPGHNAETGAHWAFVTYRRHVAQAAA